MSLIFLRLCFIGVLIILNVNCDDICDPLENANGYSGENFPSKYLTFDNTASSIVDLYSYVIKLKLLVSHFGAELNTTNCNVALGMFFTKGILKRTLKDYSHKIEKLKDLQTVLKETVNIAEDVVSHFTYNILTTSAYDIPMQLRMQCEKIFRYDDGLIYSIGNLNRGRLSKWIYSAKKLNDHIDQFDDATYPRTEYVKLIDAMKTVYEIKSSDMCISSSVENHEPIRWEEMKPCRPSPVCKEAALGLPAYAYVLTHRMLVILTRNLMRRCYLLSSPEAEKSYMDLMCANAYREAVYLARKGFFAKDMFLEHIALCGLLGYEEFYRRPWFVKAASWVDDGGCVKENTNFILNLTRHRIETETDFEEIQLIRKRSLQKLYSSCHDHPMALMGMTLAHGIRHAFHYLSDSVLDNLPF